MDSTTSMTTPQHWIQHCAIRSQPQRAQADLGGMPHVYNIDHEPDGIILMLQKPPGEPCVCLGQLGVGPNFKTHYTAELIDSLLTVCGELIDKRRNYLKPKKRKRKTKK